MVYFILGVIVGILVRDIKFKTIEKVEEFKKNIENKGETQFVEPLDVRELKKSKTVDELLAKLNLHE